MASPRETRFETLANFEGLLRRVADWIADVARTKDGAFTVALSGGSTPRRLYQILAEPSYCDKFLWSRTHWFWGDERFVPQDDALSNYSMAREALLSRAPIPATNIHPSHTEQTTPDQAASLYERELKSYVLLGLGPDGHTASLLPNKAVVAERDRWCAAVVGAKAEARITLIHPVLESSRNAVYLVAGKEKRAAFVGLRSGDASLPAAHLHPKGLLWIFGDAAAMGAVS